MKKCKLCDKDLPNRIKINGVTKNISSRKYCLECSPYGKHNTKILENSISECNGKICTICKQDKSTEEFYQNGKVINSKCKNCLISEQVLRWQRMKIDAILSKGGKCVRCGYNKNYAALEFHHRDTNTKEYSWTKLRLQKKETRQKELDKCDLLCSNCHAEIHNPQGILN